MASKNRKHVVIIGGGFAGQNAYRDLVKAGYKVTLVDRHPYSTFQPLLYQVATGGMNPGDIAYSLREFVARGHGKKNMPGRGIFRRALATGVDTVSKTVEVTNGDPIEYDTLIVAAGVGPNFFGVPGAEEHARTIYTRLEALAVRDLIFGGLENLTTAKTHNRQFTVLVVGGGPTGVETAGTLAEMKSEALPVMYPELSTDSLRVVLAERGPSLLGPFKPHLQEYTVAELRKRGVDVRLNTAVEEVTEEHVTLSGDVSLDVDLVLWCSGVGSLPEVEKFGLPQGPRGRIQVDEHFRVTDTEDVYAVGDCAVNPDNPLPQLAPPALQSGTHVAEHIIATDRGESISPFTYIDKGTMATIGRNAAVAEFPGGQTLTGIAAWLLWAGVHLATLLGGRNRIQAMINGGFRYLWWPRSATSIVGDALPQRGDH